MSHLRDSVQTLLKQSINSHTTNTNEIELLRNDLTGDGAGGDNKPGVILKAINDNVITLLNNTGQNQEVVIKGNTQPDGSGDDKEISVDSSGHLQVDVVSMSGGGDATAANQVLHNTKLDTIAGDTTSLDGKVTACNTGAVVISSSALPSGAATSALQTTGNTSLSTIAGDTTSLDGKVTACNTGAVVISSSALPSGAATSSLQGAGLPAALSTGSNLKVSIEEGQITGFSTSALQTTGNTSLSTIAGDTTSLDGKVTACNTGAVVISSSALPSGGATSALQTTGNTSLATIAGDTTSLDGKVTACNTGAVVISSSALPSGAATSALQTTGNTSLSTIAGDTTSLDGKINQGYDATISSGGSGLQQVVAYGRDSGGNLDALNVDNNGHLKVISAVVENKGSEGNILSNASLSNSSTTSSLDISDFNQVNIMYEDSNTSNSNGIRIEVSEDNSKFYPHSEIYPSVYGSVRNYVTTPALDMNGIKYIRFNNHNTGAANDLTNVHISVLGTPN